MQQSQGELSLPGAGCEFPHPGAPLGDQQPQVGTSMSLDVPPIRGTEEPMRHSAAWGQLRAPMRGSGPSAQDPVTS